jgi:predicted short-subunit dehydrogenase-like oxidoreductase (DUF2520 family)
MDEATQSLESRPSVFRDKTVAILGAGKLGCAVGAMLRQGGLRIVAASTRSEDTAELACQLIGGEACTDNTEAAERAAIILLTMNDDTIARVADELAQAGVFRPGQLVIHMSGALPLSVLDPAARAGAHVGAAHPMRSFATREQAIRDIPHSVYGVTAGPGASEELDEIVRLLEGRAVHIADEKKVLYHAAAVMASNYLVAVEDMAVQLLLDAGFDETSAMEALAPLAQNTLENVAELGTTDALTGPIVRGDVETLRAHLDALASLPPDRLRLYRALGLRAIDIAERRSTLDAETLAQMREVLGGEDET